MTSTMPHTLSGTQAPGASGVPRLVNPDDAGPGTQPRVSIVVPVRNEAHNMAPLLSRLETALAGLDAELLFADDSDDATVAAITAAAAGRALPVRVLERPPAQRGDGLSGAVIAAARHARGDWILVMDADLQHPPEAAVGLATAALRHDADIVIGTRYAGAGSTGDGLSGPLRGTVSSWATRLAKLLFPRRLAMVTDPLSGLFAFRRAAVDLARLNPLGFKILLEILVRHPAARVAEATYRFEARQAGDSKAGLRQGLMYLRHLARLRKARLAGQLRRETVSARERWAALLRLIGFGAVGATGIAVNTAALWFGYNTLGINHLVAAALATQCSTTWNFLLIDALVYRGRGQGRFGARATRFFLLNNLLLLGRLPALQLLVVWGMGVLTANAATLVALFLLRFLISDRVIYGKGEDKGRDPVHLLVDLAAPAAPTAQDAPGEPAGDGGLARKRSRYLAYRYDVAGVVRIGSQILLPELEFFRAQWTGEEDLDITVRVGDVGGRSPRRRASMTERPEAAAAGRHRAGGQAGPGAAGGESVVKYEEHLGRAGANFRITLGEQIDIEVGPLLARSPHVVYTNVLEALLRFVMVSRGRMLLHSACVELDGVGVMLSALTDTGKTGTVLRLLREHGGRFLSDDMTVVEPDGTAHCFPKPLTISSHTLRAVNADDLTRREWRRLQFQSRLHSKSGRSLAVALSRFNLPIMGINAITQYLVPPPKYTADRLVRCEFAPTVRVSELFVIERGTPRLADLDRRSAVEQMLTNTDDAYGFPPFKYLAPSITINGAGYQELRAREREILEAFLGHVRCRVLASDSFGWADEIPGLVGGEAAVPPPRPGSAPARLGRPLSAAWPRWSADAGPGRSAA
jgi:glycosyltransferase involved in cell wall biosynthesis